MPTPLPRPDRPIVLVGLMGAGKSSVGRRLALRLGLPFVEADGEIERAAGCSIAEMFERFGERHFRDLEREVMAGLAERAPCVIAAGGGAFVDVATRALILARCVAVWLDADVETLAKRVAKSDRRPLLQNVEPREALGALARKRNPLYAEAHLRVRSDAPHDQVVDRILEALPAMAATP